MEQETMLKEILHALQLHSEHVDNKFDQMSDKMDNMRSELDTKMDRGFNRLGKKIDGIRVELTETQETTDYLLSKTARHQKKLRQFSEQQ
ncbi:hypothetical protein GCM10011409_40060 [Lentibacillus populi]|uniref:Uncharacterized protein n=1 Tax=Lentibacillus populi TaxID=1827502 RepID=A0A9W5U141_9BACI|nr:hypothetical protein [Lentibacillus populi]MBT2216038.1 hypothetical protein [Virgibacillus dakarensis]GGB58580.1 hypothetical protein GCM10011409_40060 [Lentibacillus populi]